MMQVYQQQEEKDTHFGAAKMQRPRAPSGEKACQMCRNCSCKRFFLNIPDKYYQEKYQKFRQSKFQSMRIFALVFGVVSTVVGKN